MTETILEGAQASDLLEKDFKSTVLNMLMELKKTRKKGKGKHKIIYF